MMLDNNQVRKARDELGISQASLARQAGVNRTVLSSFETGQIALRDRVAEKLFHFFQAQGVELDDVEEAIAKSAHARSDKLPRIVDGILVAPALDREVVEDLFDELAKIENEIQMTESTECHRGLLGGFTSACDETFKRLLLLYARWRQTVVTLRGQSVDARTGKEDSVLLLSDRLALELQGNLPDE